MNTAVFAFFALAQAALAICAIRLLRRRPSVANLMLALPIAAVVWDNAIMSLGASIGDGPLLVALSWPRFIGHALFTPSWIVAAFGLVALSGAQWAKSRTAQVGQWVLWAVAVTAGVLRYVVFLRMSPVWDGGMFYYTNTGTFPGPPVGSIIMLFTVLALAVVIWRKSGVPWMLLGAVFMLATQLVPREVVGFLVTNSGEVIMAASLVVTAYMLQREPVLATDDDVAVVKVVGAAVPEAG